MCITELCYITPTVESFSSKLYSKSEEHFCWSKGSFEVRSK